MAVLFQLPTDLEKQLREEFSDLDQVAKGGCTCGAYIAVECSAIINWRLR